jgi:hypothetical protein
MMESSSLLHWYVVGEERDGILAEPTDETALGVLTEPTDGMGLGVCDCLDMI